MTDPQIINSLIAAGAAVIVGVLGMIGAIVSGRRERRELRRRVDAVAQDARAVRHQTQNTHDTNLRDDVDMVLRAVGRIEDSQFETRRDVSRLHHDLRELRDHVTESDGDNEKVHRNIFERLASLTNTKDQTQKDQK